MNSLKNLFWSTSFLFFIFTNLSGQETKKPVTFDDVFQSRELSSKSFRGGTPLNDGETYCSAEKDSIKIYAYADGKLKGCLVSSKQLIPEGATEAIDHYDFQLSDDETKILFATETESIYRYSSKSEYYWYDKSTSRLNRLSANGKQQLATFSPDGTQIAFVRDNNMFVKNLVSGTETQITTDGKFNYIINGAPDWVYEEEFSFSQGYFWSPDSKKIAFMRFDETSVREWQLTMWGELYPEQYKYKYPKAGEDNSLVDIYVYDILGGKSIKLDAGSEKDQYIPRIYWTKKQDVLAIFRLNRLQNKLDILFADANSGKSETVYSEENKYYIDITDNTTFIDADRFIFTSEKDGFNHIYIYNVSASELTQLTKGTYDVLSVAGYDEKTGLVYFISAETSPINKELYSVDLSGKNKKKLSERNGSNNPSFSKNYKYLVNSFSDAVTPPYITVYTTKNMKEIRVIEDNSKLVKKLESYQFSTREFFNFSTSEGVNLNGWMIKPWNFDPQKKYPVLMYVYGGPGSQTVQNSWGGGNLWYQYLSSQGMIIVSVDNRGTGARGEEFKKMTYLQLGKYETIDQIEAAKYLGTLPYVDKDRIGIWGWSYGGYMSSLCLTKGADYFRAGIAVAPVTNWRYYDNIYTERYMRKPQDNAAGYDDNSPINHADKLKGKFLLVHGTADDNVHVQNSIDFISALVSANKDFDMMVYPNSNHGIYTGRNTTLHLYTRLSDFLIENLVK